MCPGPVDTEFDAAAGMPPAQTPFDRAFRIGAERCAEEALAGFDRGAPLVYPGRAYRAFMRVREVLPLAVQRAVVASAAKR